MKKIILLVVAGMLLSTCDSGDNRQQNQAEQSGEVNKATLTQVWATDSTTLITPECVTFDPERNHFYVSNLNRDNDTEDDGYISIVNADGSMQNARWVEGLGSPLGNDFYNGHLYVSDNGTVVKIDLENGSITERIAIEGASDLNGIDIDDSGNIYVADSDGNKIFRVDQNGEVTLLLEGEELNEPNGVLIRDDELIIASASGNSLKSLNLESKQISTLVEGIGRADGIIPLENGGYLTSSWTGEVYFISADMEKQKILDTRDQEINAADIGYIVGENLLVVPTFYDNRLVAYKLTVN